MSDYFIDYAKVLADLEAKRDALNAAIDGIKKLLYINAQSLPDGTIKQMGPAQEGTEIQEDSFFGMSTPDAMEKYLKIVKKPQSHQDIADALERGGFQSTSKRFSNTVLSTLDRLSKADEPKFVRVKGLWGLAEWYPGLKRSKTARRDENGDEGDRNDEDMSQDEAADGITSEQPSSSEQLPLS